MRNGDVSAPVLRNRFPAVVEEVLGLYPYRNFRRRVCGKGDRNGGVVLCDAVVRGVGVIVKHQNVSESSAVFFSVLVEEVVAVIVFIDVDPFALGVGVEIPARILVEIVVGAGVGNTLSREGLCKVLVEIEYFNVLFAYLVIDLGSVIIVFAVFFGEPEVLDGVFDFVVVERRVSVAVRYIRGLHTVVVHV